MRKIFIVIISLIFCSLVWSATPKSKPKPKPQVTPVDQELAKLKEMLKGNKSAVRALLLYPEGTRTAIFVASGYPDTLLKVQEIQKKSSAAFHDLIANLSPDDQKDIWNLVRYPELLDPILQADSRARLTGLLANRSQPIQHAGLRFGTDKKDVLTQVQHLLESTKSEFEASLKDVSPLAQQAFRELQFRPDVLSILLKNMSTTSLVGDIYKKDSDYVNRRASELSAQFIDERENEQEDWKKQLDSSPQALKELQDSFH